MRGVIAVEGPHDVEVVGRCLKSIQSVSRVRRIEELPSEFRRLVPTRFPHNDDLLARMPVPVFLCSDALQVAVQAAPDVVTLLRDMHVAMGAFHVDAYAAIADADDLTETKKFKILHADLRAKLPALRWPEKVVTCSTSRPRTGVYVLPDCSPPGTVEDILLQGGRAH